MDPKSLYRLIKPLPTPENAAEEPDIAWLVESVEANAKGALFDEIVKQNQELLALLHELRMYQGDLQKTREDPSNPRAA